MKLRWRFIKSFDEMVAAGEHNIMPEHVACAVKLMLWGSERYAVLQQQKEDGGWEAVDYELQP